MNYQNLGDWVSIETQHQKGYFCVYRLWDFMRINLAHFQDAISKLESIKSHMGVVVEEEKFSQVSSLPIKALFLNGYFDVLEALLQQCNKLTLPSTKKLIEFELLKYKNKHLALTNNDLKSSMEYLWFSLMNEVNSRLVLILPSEKMAYFEHDHLFGIQVKNQFPSLDYDIQEAGTSFAVGRWTASVFHCMRVLEKALAALAIELNLGTDSISFENWKNIIDQIEKEIRKLDQLPKVPDKIEKLRIYSEAAKEFRYFKDAWRNHAMHSRAIYDELGSSSVLNHTKEFMIALASGGIKELI